MLTGISEGLVGGRRLFMRVNPGPLSIFKKTTWLMRFLRAGKQIETVMSLANPEDAGRMMARRMSGTVLFRPVRKLVERGHFRAMRVTRDVRRRNGMGGRSWIFSDLDRGKDGRIVKNMVVMFHDANKAGRHLDIHIGHLSLVIRVSGKPVESKIRYNRSGRLTEASRKALLDHLRDEVAQSSRMAQNLDHSPTNARMGWLKGERGLKGYGAGQTRQVVLEEPVEILSVGKDVGATLRMFCPSIWPHGQTYLHKLYPGKSGSAPIVVWGQTKPKVPVFEPKPSLVMIKPEEVEKFLKRVDPTTITVKEDGAATSFDTTDKGTTFWSPRISKETGQRIEYTHKLPELMRMRHDAHPRGRGELMFRRRMLWFPIWRKLSAAEIGGILNANHIRPRDVIPDFMVYSVDKWNGKDVSDISFHENRNLQLELADANQFIRLPRIVQFWLNQNLEGVVGVPEGKSLKDGLKLKFWGDTDDWEVESVELKYGPTGRTAGVVWFRSMSSGKRFKLGPGQLGTEKRVIEMMTNPKRFIGMVGKVKSRRGHEGRAAKLREWHLDKGVWSMGKPSTGDRVREIIADKLSIDEKKVVDNALIVADLGADSLDQVELVMALEDAWDMDIPDEDAENFSTVGKIIHYMERKVRDGTSKT